MAKIPRIGIAVLVVDLVFLTLAAGALCLRIWARRIMKLTLRLNDYAAVIAWVLAAGLVGTAISVVVSGGGGQHVQFVDPAMMKVTQKNFRAAEILWACANTAVKISILHLYTTLFPNRIFIVIDHLIMAFALLLCVGIVFGASFTCRPFSHFWSPKANGACGNEKVFGLVAGALHLLTDIIILIMPMPMLWSLHMPIAKKFQLTVMFGLGSCICILSIVRLAVLVTYDYQDITYTIAWLAIWTDLEPILGVFNACLPVVRPAFIKICKSDHFSGGTRSKGKTQSNQSWPGSLAKAPMRNNRPGFHQLDGHTYPLTGRSLSLDHGLDPESRSETFDVEGQPTISNPETP